MDSCSYTNRRSAETQRTSFAEEPSSRFLLLLLALALLIGAGSPGRAQSGQSAPPNQALLEARIAANPADAEAHFYLARIFLDNRDTKNALLHLKAAATLRPDFGPVVFQYGATQLETGDIEGGYQTLRALAAREPDEAATRAYLVRATSHLNKPEETREHLAALRRLAPTDALFHAQLVEWTATEGDPQVALDQIRFTLTLALDKRRMARVRMLESLSYNRLGDTRAAITSLQQAIELDDSNPNYYAVLFTVQGTQRMRDIDIPLLKLAVQRFPTSKELLLITGLLNLENQEYRSVREIVNRLDAVAPGSAEGAMLRGHLALAANDFSAASQRFAEALDRGMTTQHVLHNLGLAQQKSGDNMEALASFAQALKLEPARPELLFDYAKLLLNTGDPAAAEDLAIRFAGIAANDARAYKLLADIERKLGKREEAVKHLAEFKRLSIEAQATRQSQDTSPPAP